MKQLLTLTASLLYISAAFAQLPTYSIVNKNFVNKRHYGFTDEPASEEWFAASQKRILENEYNFKQAGHTNVYYTVSSSQHISFDINATGYTTVPVKFSANNNVAASWKQSFTFSEINKGSQGVKAGKDYIVIQNEAGLNFNYPTFSIQYSNSDEGLRQNFIITNKPAGNAALELLLKLSGDLSPAVVNNSLQFTDKSGNNKLYYTKLKVWDANQKVLTAIMEMRDDNTLAIVVNDKLATYPVTIDPINKTPEWTGSADGILPGLVGQMAVDAGYGFSLAGLGDVNGDGYDDVAIGAPAMADIITGTGTLASAGAVFIYLGSPAGLSNNPVAILQPTTPVAGALFGYSIAGGDINNDGKNDIIIGAPMDVVSISTGVGSTASGTVGKVYVYDGATLSTGVNPLLSLNLSGNGILENGVNLSVNALFGFSVSVTEDMNNDGKKDIIVGAPTYAGIKTGLFGNSLLDVQSGGAFVFLSNGSGNPSLVKLKPVQTSILGLPILQTNINGLLFGYSVDGLGDYNGDGYPDVVASAPAGVDLSSIAALLNGKLLQGSATVYYGTGSGINANPGATLVASQGGLLTNITGTISNIANMFGVCVRGAKSASGVRNGNIVVGAPLGGTLMNVLSLQLKTGTVSVFRKKVASPLVNVIPDQVLSSPRNSNNILQVIQSNLLFGYSIDNVLDVNCDGISDLIIGEPASSGAQLLNANVAGGAAYIYFGNADGTYGSNAFWTLTATENALLGVNATSLIGYSVAGAGHVKGLANANKVLIGTPSRTLDFGAGLLNLGSTLGTVFSLAAGDNGAGKSYLFDIQACGGPLPVVLVKLEVNYDNGISRLGWKTEQEMNSSYFEIEHSSTGNYFHSLGTVKAAGISNMEINYRFDDLKANGGLNYYRLKMVDKDGKFAYSNIVKVNVNINKTFITTVYPSPFIDRVNVAIMSASEDIAHFRLLDNTGKVIIEATSSLNKGSNIIPLNDLGYLSKGIYIMHVKVGSISKMIKLVK